MRNLILLVCVFFALSSCHNNKSIVLHIAAKGSDGAPLQRAQVSVNDKKLGTTDSSGSLVTELSLSDGEEYLLEISKESETSYYAPFIKKISAEASDGQRLQVEALLYSVPKWSFQFSEKADEVPSASPPLAKKQETAKPVPLDLEPPLEHELPEKKADGKATTQSSPAIAQEKTPQPVKQATQAPTSLTSDMFEKNTLQRGEEKLKEGDLKAAVEIFRMTAPQDKDYSKAWQKVGDIYLSFLDDPKQAREAFSRVTKHMTTDRERSEYFLSYVREGVSLYYLGESMLGERQKKDAHVHFIKAQKRLERASRIKSAKLPEILHEAFYFKALAAHHIWRISNQDKDSKLAKSHWQDYVKFAGQNKKASQKSFLANAQVFLRELSPKERAL